MQKKLIALAVATAFSAPAFADVTTYGLIDFAVVNVSASGQKSNLVAISNASAASRVGFKASEDLSNGMKAVVVMEYGFETDSSLGLTGAKARQNMLAVVGDFGTVAAGYLQTTVYDFNAKFDPVYGSKASPAATVTKGGGFLQDGAARAQHAVAYISPNFSGVKVAVNYSTALSDTVSGLGLASNAATGNKTTAFLLSGGYDAGPLTVMAVYGKTANEDTAPQVATTSEVMVGGSYDLGVAKLMGTFASSNTGAATKVTNTAFSFSAVMPVSTGAIAASYAANKMNTANTNGSGFVLGYLHTLSKETTAYVAYESVSNGSATKAYSVAGNAVAAASPNGSSSSLIAVGLRKKF
jgi:predicted porin